jgi:hypothetical protein
MLQASTSSFPRGAQAAAHHPDTASDGLEAIAGACGSVTEPRTEAFAKEPDPPVKRMDCVEARI